MKWIKKGLIFEPECNKSWWKSHTLSPIALVLDEEKIRVFIGAMDSERVSRITYVDLSTKDPTKVLNVGNEPILDIGRPGTFDESGVFPASAIWHNDKIYLYYTGFQNADKVRYYMYGGLAISEDNGETFKRISEVPIMDRADEALFFRGGPSVLYENGVFKTYYSSGSEWIEDSGSLRPRYNVSCTESKDGINFPNKGSICIRYDLNQNEYGLGRPQIMKANDAYILFYTRRILGMKYSMGYSISKDGLKWERKDNEIGITHSKNDWDSDMVYFPSVIKNRDNYYLFYNGNNYGEKGFGLALLEKW